MDSQVVEVSGGSHKIATAITDLYSLSHGSSQLNRIDWIEPGKPIQFVFSLLSDSFLTRPRTKELQINGLFMILKI